MVMLRHDSTPPMLPEGHKFCSVTVLVTPGIREGFKPLEILPLLRRHFSGDWGDLDTEDKASNDAALGNGARILSAYSVGGDEERRVWIITDAANDAGRRLATTILLPDEY